MPGVAHKRTAAAPRYGARAWSPGIVRRLEEACNAELLAPGFPPQIIDDEPEAEGYEVIVERGG